MSFLDRGPVRNLLQFQGLPQFGPIRHELDGLAIVGLEELTQRQKGEELGLREVLSTVRTRVHGQALASDAQSQLGKIDWRLGHGPHGLPPLSLHAYSSAIS